MKRWEVVDKAWVSQYDRDDDLSVVRLTLSRTPLPDIGDISFYDGVHGFVDVAPDGRVLGLTVYYRKG